MRLERLEINGFKSFSDRSELAFDKGVTAIVGPNGCGKSNVADAITWVMGEQSAKSLRGERMEDVICNGSDARKPSAAAEVRLRFSGVVKNVSAPALEMAGAGANLVDEAAGPSISAEEVIQSVAREVEVTRRLYRSGESEYLIDGQVARLRDVHELLMDTGLGAKAYAIIEQGKIGMILSTRPTDRRQLIEEAAGVTKYKSRRRAAELKLEAAQQNLTRIDDIVFEVEKQRGTLKRQAGKARRYQKLRDQLRRWEKVLFARKYRQLAETIQSARARLADAREKEAAAAARLAEVESDLSRMRIELTEADARATAAREAAHACELAINRQQQQIAFDAEQIGAFEARTSALDSEIASLDARREPQQALLGARRQAAQAANEERDRAAAALSAGSEAYETAHRSIEGLEADVEAARSEVFSALNSATALRHALEHAGVAGERVAETLAKLDVEFNDVRIETDRVEAERAAALDALKRAQHALDATRIARAARESELASARIEHEWRASQVRAREHEIAGLSARLTSLEQLDADRAGFSDAARAVLANANGHVNQKGAVADYIDVETGYERAVDACLADLLQHVVVERAEHAAAGFAVVRDADAGRCGFLIADGAGSAVDASVRERAVPEGVVPLASVTRVRGDYAGAILFAMGDAWIADSYERAETVSRIAACPVVTAAGEVFHGPNLVTGGIRRESQGILERRREIKDLRDRIASEREQLTRLAEETGVLDTTIAQALSAIDALTSEHHKQEKAIVGHEARLRQTADESARLAQKLEQLTRERRQAEDEREMIDRRQGEARVSISRLQSEQQTADDRLSAAQRRLFEARESAESLSQQAADARAAHAALVERATALAGEVERLEEAGAELEARAVALAVEREETRRRIAELQSAIVTGKQRLDEDIRALEGFRQEVALADESAARLRANADEHEGIIKQARGALEGIRATVSELDIARATAESDLSHLSTSCIESVQSTLDQVLVEVDELERQGEATPDARVIYADQPDESEADSDEENAASGVGVLSTSAVEEATERALSAEDAIAELRRKIERLGPVNMMAIEQFDELESRHAFLTTQRKDLVDSIAQTSEAIKRIDETTRQRFAEAFAAINRNFQEMFNTLFGGGRAGLTLLDENDPLESGIEIVAQPPGKRLQSVQLLSGGEKALTAIALMFGLFKYKPSPFCLLDEIDAPLDDANVGRFVEMLRAMLHHTQFILITHNRKTMEIADRLYGVTMEEPGVSKLISVQLN
jgi:chromosome segregation protein